MTVILAGARSVRAANPIAYSNPIHLPDNPPHDELRDPCIIREGDTWYLVFTMFPFRGHDERHLKDPNQGSSPGIRIYSSKDLKNWTAGNWLIKGSDLPDDCPYKDRFWAPEIHKINGRFYLIFTADNWIKDEYNPAGKWGAAGYTFIGVADKVTGPYMHVTYLSGGACDTTIMQAADGKVYAFIPRGNIDVQEIDLSHIDRDMIELAGHPKMIVSADNRDIGKESNPKYLEGPWATRTGDHYCLFFAANYDDPKFPEDRGYWTGVAYADNPMGPWKKDPRGKIFLGGHLAVFDGPDGRNWFSYRGEGNNRARGFLCIDPFSFSAAGLFESNGPTVGDVSTDARPPDAVAIPIPAAVSPAAGVVPADTASLQHQIEAAFRAGQKKLAIAPGTYPMTGRLQLRGLSNFEIDATGVTFSREDPAHTGINFDDCTNVTLRGLTLRCDRAPHTQGTILAIDPDGAWIDLRVDTGYAADYLNKTTGYCFDPKTRQWKAGTFDYGIERTEPREGNVARLILDGKLDVKNSRMTPGDLMGFRGPGNTDIVLDGCARMKLIGLTLLGGSGFCVLEAGGEGDNYYSYKLTYCPTPPGATAPPLIASNADAFHSASVRHGPTLEDCSFEGMCDDGIPIHGAYSLVVAAGKREITIAGPNDQNFFRPGDALRLLDADAWVVGEAKVLGCELLGDFHPAEPIQEKPFSHSRKFVRLTLDRALAAQPGQRVSDPNANGSGFVIRRCTIRNHRARGLLIKADDGLIENNTIVGSTIADLVVSPEYYWNEADYSRKLVIRNNLFGRCGYATTGPWNQQAGALTIVSEAKSRGPAGYGHRHIVIEGNTFEDNDAVNVLINSAQDVLVKSNRFIRPGHELNLRGSDRKIDPGALIFVSDADDVRIEDNSVFDAGPYTTQLVETAPTATNVTGGRDGVKAMAHAK